MLSTTGFAGSLAIPGRLARHLRLEFLALAPFVLATGRRVELPTYAGSVRIGSRIVETWFTVGDALVGMEFLQQVCSGVQLNLDAHTIELLLR